jgi:hypothetical protein
MSDFYKFVFNEDELHWFYDHCIPRLKQDETFFCSLSARNKALTPEEREYYKIGRSEMFNKTLIRHDTWEIFAENIYRFETNKLGYITKNNIPYPQKCLTIYWNIDPANVRAVINQQQILLLNLQDELINSALKKSRDGVDEAFHKMRKVFDSTISLYARNFGTKYWYDIDIDLPKDVIKNNITAIHDIFTQKIGLGNFYMIDTHGGMHIIFRKKMIKFNPKDLITSIIESIYHQKTLPENVEGEVIINDNRMIALPGCCMAGKEGPYLVTILNKEDAIGMPDFKLETE